MNEMALKPQLSRLDRLLDKGVISLRDVHKPRPEVVREVDGVLGDGTERSEGCGLTIRIWVR